LGRVGRRQFRRLVRRSLATWPIWVTAAAALSAGLTASAARKPPEYTVTVALLVTGIRPDAQYGSAQIRGQVTDLTFTRPNLAGIIKRHAKELPSHGRDFDLAYEFIIEHLKVDVLENDFIGANWEMEKPRTARVTLSLTGGKPQIIWEIVHELADLLIDSTLARRHAAMLREQAGAETAVNLAQTTAADAPDNARWWAYERFKKQADIATTADLRVRAAHEKQGLHFDLVDPGRVPKDTSIASFMGDAVLTFILLLLSASLLIGAFDPRVLDAGDLAIIGVPPIGRLPPLPDPRREPPQGQRNAPDASSAPSADSGPSV